MGSEAPGLANRSAELAIVDVELLQTFPSLNNEDRSCWFWCRWFEAGFWSLWQRAKLIGYLLEIHDGDICWIMMRRIRNMHPHGGSAFLLEESWDVLVFSRFLKLTQAAVGRLRRLTWIPALADVDVWQRQPVTNVISRALETPCNLKPP